jgi:hypothetical protein
MEKPMNQPDLKKRIEESRKEFLSLFREKELDNTEYGLGWRWYFVNPLLIWNKFESLFSEYGNNLIGPDEDIYMGTGKKEYRNDDLISRNQLRHEQRKVLKEEI